MTVVVRTRPALPYSIKWMPVIQSESIRNYSESTGVKGKKKMVSIIIMKGVISFIVIDSLSANLRFI